MAPQLAERIASRRVVEIARLPPALSPPSDSLSFQQRSTKVISRSLLSAWSGRCTEVQTLTRLLQVSTDGSHISVGGHGCDQFWTEVGRGVWSTRTDWAPLYGFLRQPEACPNCRPIRNKGLRRVTFRVTYLS